MCKPGARAGISPRHRDHLEIQARSSKQAATKLAALYSIDLLRRAAEPAKNPIPAAKTRNPAGCLLTTSRRLMSIPPTSWLRTYAALLSSLPAAFRETVSIVSDPRRPVARTEEAAFSSASAVPFRTSSNFSPAVRPKSSKRSRTRCAPAPAFAVFSVTFISLPLSICFQWLSEPNCAASLRFFADGIAQTWEEARPWPPHKAGQVTAFLKKFNCRPSRLA